MIVGLNLTSTIDGLTQHVEHASECGFADGYRDGNPGVGAILASHHAVGAAECHAANSAATEVLLHFAS